MANNEHVTPGEDDQQITLIDEKGNEELYQVLFTFDSEDYGKSYVLLYPASESDDQEVEIQAFSFTPDENGDAMRAISLVSHTLVITLVFTHSVLDGTLDVVFRHVFALTGSDDRT